MKGGGVMNPRELTLEERLQHAARIILEGIEENMIAAAMAEQDEPTEKAVA